MEAVTDEPVCGYCAHPAGMHVDGRCWAEVHAVGGGWRRCSCLAFVAAAA